MILLVVVIGHFELCEDYLESYLFRYFRRSLIHVNTLG